MTTIGQEGEILKPYKVLTQEEVKKLYPEKPVLTDKAFELIDGDGLPIEGEIFG